MNLSVALLDRVFLPLVGLPHGVTGMAAARGAAFAAAMRMVDRVHGDAAIVRTLCRASAMRPALPIDDVPVVRVRHRADGGEAAGRERGAARPNSGAGCHSPGRGRRAGRRCRPSGRSGRPCRASARHCGRSCRPACADSGMALPGFTSACSPATTLSPTARRCGARM